MSVILFLLFVFTLFGGIGFGAFQAFSSTPGKNGFGSTKSFNILTAVKYGVLGFVLSLLPLALFMGYSPVNQGTVGVVTRMGKAVRTIGPGPHIITPFVESVDPVSTKTLKVVVNEDASSLDLQQVHTEVTFTYHFDGSDKGIIYLFSNIIDNSPNAVENKIVIPAILEAIKATTAKYNVQELIEKRTEVRNNIEGLVKVRIAPHFVIGEDVSITDFRFSKDYEASIEAKQVAQQDAEKEQNILQKKKVQAEQAKVDAEGQANAAAAAADGEARAILLKANAQAEANRKLAASLTQTLILNKAIEKWNGQRPMVEGGGKGTGLLIQLPAMSNTPSDKDDQ